MNDLAKKLLENDGALPSPDEPVIGSKERQAIKYFVDEMGGFKFLERFEDFMANSGFDTGIEDVDEKAELLADQRLVGRGLEAGTPEYDSAFDVEFDKAVDELSDQANDAPNPKRAALFNRLVEELRQAW